MLNSLRQLLIKYLFVMAIPFVVFTTDTLAVNNGDLIFAVSPRKAPLVMHEMWAPLTEYLSAQTGRHISLQVAPSRTVFEEGLKSGKWDLAYMNPYNVLQAYNSQGYIPLVRDGKTDLSGILVVRNDSEINDVTMLGGRDIAFPGKNSLGASLMMRTLLNEKEKIDFNASYVGTHGNVYRHVIAGRATAGGGVNKTLAQERPELREQLRIIYQTPNVAPHPIAAHPRVDEDLRNKITQAIFDLAKTPQGKVILRQISMEEPVLADYKTDYLPLSELGLEKYIE